MALEINGASVSAFQSGVQGFNRASDNINQAASNIANANRDGQAATTPEATTTAAQQLQNTSPNTGTNLTTDLVNLNVNLLNAQASAKVIETASDMVGTLINETV